MTKRQSKKASDAAFLLKALSNILKICDKTNFGKLLERTKHITGIITDYSVVHTNFNA